MSTFAKSRSAFFCMLMGVLLVGASAFGAEKEKKEWAVLTFLNGFNNLDSFGYADMNEMEKIGSTPRVHVISQWASLKTKEVKRVYLQKDDDFAKVTSPVIENLGKVDMGDYRTLIDFVKWAVKKYPAQRYFVNVWNHGNGWHLQGNQTGPTRDVSYDDLSGNKITTEQLGDALAQISKEIGQKIDLFGSDSCLMAMAEVGGEMKSSVGHFVASEEVEPADGWPYDTFLAKVNEGGSKSAAEVGSILTKVYVDSYANGRDATLSTMDMAQYSSLANAVRDLGDAIKSLPTAVRQKVLQAVSRTQSYTNDDYKDLGDFINQLSQDPAIDIRPEILSGVRTALKGFVISNHTSDSMKRSQGVAIWFPDTSWQFNTYKARYKALVFNQDTAWIDAIASTVSAAAAF